MARRQLVASLTQGYLGTEWNEDCVSRDKRAYPADSEELAEGRVGEFVTLMRNVPNREGVLFESIEDDFQDEAYAVVIDGQRQLIHDASTLGTWDSRTVSTKRFLEIVNGLLRQAGSSEKLYGIYGDNDGRAISPRNGKDQYRCRWGWGAVTVRVPDVPGITTLTSGVMPRVNDAMRVLIRGC